jgi:signal peptidase I
MTTDAHPRRSMARTVRTLGRHGLGIALWLLAISVGLLLVVPALMGFDRYVIVGRSMTGAFDRGSVVFSEDVPIASLEEGDVITYQPPVSTGLTSLVTHRIVEIDRTDQGELVLRTKGDANAAEDPWTFSLPGARQNRVVHAVPHVGTALTFLSAPSNRVLVLGVPAALIALGAVRDLVRALRRQPSPAADAATADLA